MSNPPHQRIEQLEGQIRYELERRFNDLVTQYRKRAQSVLAAQEMEIFTVSLNTILQNPQVELSEQARQVFHKLDSDAPARELFERISKVIALRGRAQETGATLVAPSASAVGPATDQALMQAMASLSAQKTAGEAAGAAPPTDAAPPPAANLTQDASTVKAAPRPYNTAQLSQEILRTAQDLANLVPQADHWAGWIVTFLQALEKEAKLSARDEAYQSALEHLQDLIQLRIDQERW